MVVGGVFACCYGTIGLRHLQDTGYAVLTWPDYLTIAMPFFSILGISLGSVVYFIENEALGQATVF